MSSTKAADLSKISSVSRARVRPARSASAPARESRRDHRMARNGGVRARAAHARGAGLRRGGTGVLLDFQGGRQGPGHRPGHRSGAGCERRGGALEAARADLVPGRRLHDRSSPQAARRGLRVPLRHPPGRRGVRRRADEPGAQCGDRRGERRARRRAASSPPIRALRASSISSSRCCGTRCDLLPMRIRFRRRSRS